MQSTLKLRDSDPHDIFAIAPEEVPVAWADKVLADITGDIRSAPSQSADQPQASAAAVTAPTVDTTFRATAVDDLQVANDRPVDPPTSKWAKSAVMLVFALCSAAAAAAWQHHGDAAKQMISNWVPGFALSSSPPTEKPGSAEQTDTPAVSATAVTQTLPQAPAQPAATATTPSPDTAQSIQWMSRDLAAMGQQVEQLKASIAELKASQQASARDVARPSELRASEVRTPARPKLSAPQPRTAAVAAPSRRPMPPAYSPAAPPPLTPPALPQAAPSYTSLPSAPPQQAVDQFNDPVVRPPMPLR
jgi:hypothetical protein